MREIVVPDPIREALESGATLAISISGGKDSQAMLWTLSNLRRREGWLGDYYAVHAHLGRAEWPQTLAHCEHICEAAQVRLVVVSRPQGDLLQEIRDRMEKLRGTGKVGWPDAQNRYCTAHQKQNQIDKVTRNPWPTSTERYCTADQKRDQIVKEHRKAEVIVAAMGMRAAESPARAKKQAVALQTRTTASALTSFDPCTAMQTAKPGQRVAIDWLPIHDWSEEDVWAAMGHSKAELEWRRWQYREGWEKQALDGWRAHPAYVFGNERLSCVFCILASANDLTNGMKHNPELYQEYVRLEQESGFTFQHNRSLAGLSEASK